MKSQVLHAVWCYISGEAAGEIWYWSLFGVEGSRGLGSVICVVSRLYDKLDQFRAITGFGTSRSILMVHYSTSALLHNCIIGLQTQEITARMSPSVLKPLDNGTTVKWLLNISAPQESSAFEK